MARFVCLLRFTERGAKHLKQSTARARAFDRAAARAGVTIEAQYWTMGVYDGVLILSADSEEKALHCLSELAAGGNVRTETLPAFDAGQFAAIVGR
jgi:uncharacterized protein with GYD domain